ncbi:hypothetical protein RJT34_15854 [Clitoria ternatea]|uniref:Uncharacterized protein n=1 Tax=Clitoria ternatea TaxID=43366 RepID=A0AAN9J7A3_CLITE
MVMLSLHNSRHFANVAFRRPKLNLHAIVSFVVLNLVRNTHQFVVVTLGSCKYSKIGWVVYMQKDKLGKSGGFYVFFWCMHWLRV